MPEADNCTRVARAELQALRLRLLLSGEDLALRAGIAMSTYQRIERGEQNPHPRTMRRLAHALGVDDAETHRLIHAEEARGPLWSRPRGTTRPRRPRSVGAPVDGLVAARRRRGWSLQAASSHIGVSVQGLRSWEVGDYQPRPRWISYIARAYEVPEDEVRGWWKPRDR